MNASTEFWRDPAMPYVESRRACHSRACYRPHSHPTYSIGAVDHGVSVFSGTGDGLTTLHAGAVVFVPPRRVHACNPMPEEAWSYQMLHLDAQWLYSVRQEGAKARPVDMQGEPIRLANDAWVYTRFCRLNALLFSEASVHDKEAALIGFIGDCDGAHGQPVATPSSDPAIHGRLSPVMDFLRHERMDTPSLAELAGMAAMLSGPYASAAWKVAYGAWMFGIVLLWDLLVAAMIGNPLVLRSFSRMLPWLERVCGGMLILLAFGVIAALLAS
ncbi:AraC family ligand binding domain-containing protein [Billgrantia endophytica]|uniref:AraC family transcriptional regulator n=1 Tax=Billgrantia endophytica TaxID=2033802 RepID=A0A2N7TXC9_9GAMM|nr:AraC family ligand binding domain-containing protein [Halomonas endophytica]PMR72847.1 AraC family transcriptional regulator [Halomonas endophytica]